MQQNIGQRLEAIRGRQFVGREEELTLFRSALSASESPFCLLYVHGPAGVGKTTLLQVMAAQCHAWNIRCFPLDARNSDPSPAGFVEALRTALDLPASQDPISFLGADTGRYVLFIDTFEMLDGMYTWFRDAFLPHVSTNLLIVFAGRDVPTSIWPQDSGWQSVLQTVNVQNFDDGESQSYLSQRGVPATAYRQAFLFTHGHPLALSLIADLYHQHHPTELFSFMQEAAPPEVVRLLLTRFLAETPSGLKRTALEICALVRGTTEALLQEMLFSSAVYSPASPETAARPPANEENASSLFVWLRTLSFIASGPFGLFPHDTAREALLADLRWRNPDWYVELHHRARAYYTRQLQQAASSEQQKRLLYDCIFLHRDNAIVRAAFTWKETPEIFADQFRPSDTDSILEMVRAHEGKEAARIAASWLDRQPEATVVFRDSTKGDAPLAFVTLLKLQEASEADIQADPATRAAWTYLCHNGPLRRGEGASYLRFWMTGGTYQVTSPLQSMLIVHILRYFLTQGSRLAFTFFCCGDGDLWQTVFDYAEIARVNAEFALDARHYYVFGHDWRLNPLTEWLSLMAEKEVSTSRVYGVSSKSPQTVGAILPASESFVLNASDFETAVRDALRILNQPDKLLHSPLLYSRLVAPVAQDSRAEMPARAAALKALLYQAAEALNEPGSRLHRGYRALRHTYFSPTPTQEAAAELLGLPFSTYRRHLAEGMAALVQVLWRKEIGEDRK